MRDPREPADLGTRAVGTDAPRTLVWAVSMSWREEYRRNDEVGKREFCGWWVLALKGLPFRL
jgi:hypothetical protein